MGKEKETEEPEEEGEEEEEEEEAQRLKSLAESRYKDSNLKSALKYAKRAHKILPNNDGISSMVTAFTILKAASESPTSPDWYKILQAEPFCQFGTIKKQYKKLALTLHPDKNPHVGSEEAFKLVNEGFRFLSDKIRRKDYDMKLRIRIQNEALSGTRGEDETSVWGDTFWTACSKCRLLHQFERKYLGQGLVCPSCGKSFEALEIGSDEDNNTDNNIGVKKSSISEPRRKRISSVGDIMERSLPKRVRVDDETMTLAEFQSRVKRKAQKEKMKPNLNERKERVKRSVPEKSKELKKCSSLSIQTRKGLRDSELAVMTVEDSDFHDFDRDRVEKSFKKGQIWAIYDDDDGMPRNYGLIDEVVSVNPFEVKISWLDHQSNADEAFPSSESCGRFKLSRKTSVGLVNIFSHVVDCERAAREIYRIYPKKGSIWAIYKGAEQRCYDIVVMLTSYSDMHGLSMAYLDKVDGFKTVFQRREIGPHSIMWLERDSVGGFSHQIPARKLSGDEDPGIPKDSWELDPASLPENLLRIGCQT